MTETNESSAHFCLEDLGKFQLAGRAVLSPDGRFCVVPVQTVNTEKNSYRANLWLYTLGTKEWRQFTYGDQNDMQPVWSPDSETIVFIANRGEKTRLWKIRRDGGEAQPLGSFDKGSLSSPAWSPDGKWIAVLYQKRTPVGYVPVPAVVTDAEPKPAMSEKAASTKEDDWEKKEDRRPKVFRRLMYKADGVGFLSEEYTHVWLVDAVSGECRQVSSGPFDHESCVWFPDSASLAVVSNRHDDAEFNLFEMDLWKLSIEDGLYLSLNTPQGLCMLPSVSADGQSIAFIGMNDTEPFWSATENQLWFKKIGDVDWTCLTEGSDLAVGNYISSDCSFLDAPPAATWSPSGEALFFTASVKGACHFYRIDIPTRKITCISRDPGDIRSFSLSADGTKAVVNVADLSGPSELSLYTFGRQLRQKRISSFNRDLLKTKKVAKPEECWFEFEHTKLQAWLIKPPDFDPNRKYPLVLEIHGGPHILYGYTFMFEFQYLAAQGYLVLYVNPRGSQGYGREFARTIIKDWGGPDYRDIMHVLGVISKRPYVDGDRLGVTGGSYGGFMTNWIVGHSDDFKAAVTQRSVTSLLSLYGTSDSAHGNSASWGCNPWEDPALYARMSPLTYVDRITTPLLIIHSEEDHRCPIEQGEQLFRSLKHLRQMVEFVRYPGECHELSRSGAIDHRLDRLSRIAGWFNRYVKDSDEKKDSDKKDI